MVLDMKERYFNESFLMELREKYFRERQWKKLKKFKRVAILGIDLQKYFLNEGSRAFLPSSNEFIERLRKFYDSINAPIILTRHHDENSLMEFWWDSRLEKESKFFDIVDDLKPFGDHILNKTSYSAFYKTGLEELLRSLRAETVVITGVMTHLCCETTAREAFIRGFKVIFPVDGTLTQNRAFHEGTIRAMAHGFAVTPLIGEVKEWLLWE